MMRAVFVLCLLAGCGDDSAMEDMASHDLSVGDQADDLSMQCLPQGGGTCQGVTCEDGCKCFITTTERDTDAGATVPGPPIGTCDCSPLTVFDGPWLCCGGVYCLTKAPAMPICDGTACRAP